MKTFMAPIADVKKFDVEDILTTSSAVEPVETTTEDPLMGLSLVGSNCA